jgi:hypothetical protein
MSGKSLAYLINKRGDKKFRDGGTDLYSKELELLVQELIKKIPQEFKTQIFK